MTLHFDVMTTNIELSPKLSRYIDKRLGKIERFIPDSPKNITAQVEVGKTTKGQNKGDIFRAEINLNVSGQSFRAEAVEKNVRIAIDKIEKEVSRQLKQTYKRKQDLFRRGARKFKRLLRRGRNV